MTDAYRELGDHISAALGDAVLRTEVVLGELMVYVPAARLARVLGFLRDDQKCLFKMLVDVCGVDYPERAARFDVVYNLLSLKHNQRIRVKIETDEENAVPSVTGIYSAAYRIVDICTAPMRALLTAAYPRFFRSGAKGITGSAALARRLAGPDDRGGGVPQRLGADRSAPWCAARR